MMTDKKNLLFVDDEQHVLDGRHARTDCVIMLDVDHFKALNDSQGHAKGDDVLRQVALCVRQTLRATDVAGRLGGEKLVVLLPETPLDDAFVVAEQIRETLWNANIPHYASGTADRITVSLGVAAGLARNWEDVVREADQALYASKENGRNMVSGSNLTPGHSGVDDSNPIIRRKGAA
ncbi:MAG: GGDEF domain-containing protein [Planctomycetes bacterium]|nr:GGDEF domain-containing protein [Planctomycetota bacterium]